MANESLTNVCVPSQLLGKAVMYLLPSQGGSGGAHAIVREALALCACGLHVTIAAPDANMPSLLIKYPEARHLLRSLGSASDQEIMEASPDFDIAIATNCGSVKLLQKISLAYPNTIPMYYVQDYEPWFFHKYDPRRREANQSYTLIPNMICFAYSDWCRYYVKKLHGIEVRKTEPSFDHQVVNSLRQDKLDVFDPRRIIAMVRPNSPRRAPLETLAALKNVKEKYGPGVDIRILGSNAAELVRWGQAASFEFTNLGYLDKFQVAKALSEADMFMDLSHFQAFSQACLEAMAVGCAVILPKNCGSDQYARNQENCLTVKTADQSQILFAVETLMRDQELLLRLKKTGVCTAQKYSMRDAVESLLNLFLGALLKSS